VHKKTYDLCIWTMLKKIKYSKIAIVIFLTVLIWVWADLALDESVSVPSATITIAESSPTFWVSFDGKASTSISNIVLKGPASKIADIKAEINDSSLKLNFSFNPGLEGITTDGSHTLNVLDFIKNSAEMRELRGLTAESCEPNTITVDVARLVERPLSVQCVDESGNVLKFESVDPATVNAPVPSNWGLDKLIAQVKLTRSEIELARTTPVKKTPFVELAPEQIREVAAPVTIKLPAKEEQLGVKRIEDATLVIAMSPTLLAKYYVEVTNLPSVLNPIAVRATDEAKEAYENQALPQMTLYIFDSDTKKGEEGQSKKVVYNFPPEYVRKGEIELVGEPATAEFKLIPRPSAASE
jgi:hypothetical protein